jgi:hypothetical protein
MKNRNIAHVVPAAPGYFMLPSATDEEGRFESTWSLAVVAWLLDSQGEIAGVVRPDETVWADDEPVDDWTFLQPDGTVMSVCRYFPNREAYEAARRRGEET